MGGGVAFLDYDGDGDQDLFFVNSTRWPEGPRRLAARRARALPQRRHGPLPDVTASTGLDVSLYGMGVAVGDYDNDGDVDLFVTGGGRQPAAPQRRGGSFADVTAAAGVARRRDGVVVDERVPRLRPRRRPRPLRLQLRALVARDRPRGRLPAHRRRPRLRPAAQLRGHLPLPLSQRRRRHVHRRLGAGRRADQERRDRRPGGKSLGVAPVDVDGDGWLDLVVANDTVQQLPLPQPAGRHVRREGRGLRRSPSTATATPPAPWASTPPASATTTRWRSPSATSPTR